jgi:acylphosphatase
MNVMKRLEATVYGRVQGVYFRYYTVRQAEALDVTGWVANQPDGAVRVVAEGPAERLADLAHWLRQGSPGAQVERVETNWAVATGEFREFQVRWL